MPSPKRNIVRINRCYHGGPDYAELDKLGLRPDDVLDFSSNSNPYPFKLSFTLDDVVIDHYPDSDSTELRRLIAGQNRIAVDEVIVGAGSMEIIRLITQSYLGEGDKTLVLKPTFGEYELGCRIAGAEVVELWAEEKNDFCFDVKRCADLISQLKPKLVFVCNPNNPTGQYLSKSDIELILDTAGDETLVVLDEAYIAFTEMHWAATDLVSQGNLIIIRSMTKDFALAGLRLGYGIGCAGIISQLMKVKPPWNVNVVAQSAGKQALEDRVYIRRSEAQIRHNRDYLLFELNSIGYHPINTRTNFFLLKVGDAHSFREALMSHGIIVRDCASFGLPEYVRIAPRTLPECRKLVQAIKNN